MERRGIPAAVVGVEKLVMTTGKGMARAQGYPDFPMVVIRHSTGHLMGLDDANVIRELAEAAAPQIAAILLGEVPSS